VPDGAWRSEGFLFSEYMFYLTEIKVPERSQVPDGAWRSEGFLFSEYMFYLTEIKVPERSEGFLYWYRV